MILTANSASPGLGLNSVTPLIANQGRKQSLNPAKIKNEERKKKFQTPQNKWASIGYHWQR